MERLAVAFIRAPRSLEKLKARATLGGPSMPNPTTRQLLRRLAAAFAASFVSLTILLLAIFATRQLPHLVGKGTEANSVAQALLLAVPFTAAITIPMAVFVAVLWVFTRLGAEGALEAALQTRHGVRRLVAPVLWAAAAVAALTLAWNAELVPRANERLVDVLSGGAAQRNARTMTIAELRAAAQRARANARSDAPARVASYEVEVQKKYALAAACVVLALVAAAIALRVPSGGAPLVIGASLAAFGAYYVCLITGETLADRLVLSPGAAMWMANAVFFAVALLLTWRSRTPRAPAGTASLAIGR